MATDYTPQTPQELVQFIKAGRPDVVIIICQNGHYLVFGDDAFVIANLSRAWL